MSEPTSRQLVRQLIESGTVDTAEIAQKSLLSKRRVQQLVKEYYEEKSFRRRVEIRGNSTVVYESPSVTYFISGSVREFYDRK